MNEIRRDNINENNIGIRFTRGTGESRSSYLSRVEANLRMYTERSNSHLGWYTHKNPYGCFICDIVRLLWNFYYEMENELPGNGEERINTKSPIDQTIMSKAENNDQEVTNQETDNEGGLDKSG